MTQDLDELKERLYRAFDRAIERSEYYGTKDADRAQSERAAAELAKAIVEVETRLDEKKSGKKRHQAAGETLTWPR